MLNEGSEVVGGTSDSGHFMHASYTVWIWAQSWKYILRLNLGPLCSTHIWLNGALTIIVKNQTFKKHFN
jgi:hypothetical protein